MRLTGRLLVCMAVLAGASQVAPSHAQQAASPPGAIKPYNAVEPARTPKERGARTSGRFAKDDTLNLTTQKIRKDGAGPCDTVNTAVDSGANSATVVCDGGKHSYFMQRGAKEWTYVAPPLITATNPPSGR